MFSAQFIIVYTSCLYAELVILLYICYYLQSVNPTLSLISLWYSLRLFHCMCC